MEFLSAEKKLQTTDDVHIFTGHLTWQLHGGAGISHLARRITENG
jgi:hypothetical protein